MVIHPLQGRAAVLATSRDNVLADFNVLELTLSPEHASGRVRNQAPVFVRSPTTRSHRSESRNPMRQRAQTTRKGSPGHPRQASAEDRKHSSLVKLQGPG